MVDVEGTLRVEVPKGSFDRAARWTTASNPSRSSPLNIPQVNALAWDLRQGSSPNVQPSNRLRVQPDDRDVPRCWNMGAMTEPM